MLIYRQSSLTCLTGVSKPRHVAVLTDVATKRDSVDPDLIHPLVVATLKHSRK